MYLTDLIGEEIKIGSLIAFTKSNETELQVGIVIEISGDKINFPIKTRRAKYTYSGRSANRYGRKVRTGRKFVGWSDWKVRASYIKIDPKKETQGRMVIIKNPLYLLDNPNIAAQLEVADMAKDAGMLPSNYELGVPVSR